MHRSLSSGTIAPGKVEWHCGLPRLTLGCQNGILSMPRHCLWWPEWADGHCCFVAGDRGSDCSVKDLGLPSEAIVRRGAGSSIVALPLRFHGQLGSNYVSYDHE